MGSLGRPRKRLQHRPARRILLPPRPAPSNNVASALRLEHNLHRPRRVQRRSKNRGWNNASGELPTHHHLSVPATICEVGTRAKIVHQVLEAGDVKLTADLYNHLTDAHVGLAGLASSAETAQARDRHLDGALLYVERANNGTYHPSPGHPCPRRTFPSISQEWLADLIWGAAYTRVEDLDGVLATIAKKAMLYDYRGEEALAREMEEVYARTVEGAERRIEEMMGRNL